MNKYISIVLVAVVATGISSAVAYWQGLHSFTFAWILNFMLMTMVLHFTETFKPRLTSGYYDSKKWENEGITYKRFGVDGFRRILVWVGWEKLNKISNPVKKKLDALKHLEYGTRKSEFGHLIIFFVVLAVALFVGAYYGIRQSLWLHGLNIVLNAYPVILQRHNRPRLQRAIRLIEKLQSEMKTINEDRRNTRSPLTKWPPQRKEMDHQENE